MSERASSVNFSSFGRRLWPSFSDDPTNPRRPPGLALTAKTNDRCSRGNDRVEKMVDQPSPFSPHFADFNEKLQDLSFILENS